MTDPAAQIDDARTGRERPNQRAELGNLIAHEFVIIEFGQLRCVELDLRGWGHLGLCLPGTCLTLPASKSPPGFPVPPPGCWVA